MVNREDLRRPKVHFADSLRPAATVHYDADEDTDSTLSTPRSSISTPPVCNRGAQKIYVLTYESDSELFLMEARFGNLGVYTTLEQASEAAHRYIHVELEDQLDKQGSPIRTRARTKEQNQNVARSYEVKEGQWVSSLEIRGKKLLLCVEEWPITS